MSPNAGKDESNWNSQTLLVGIENKTNCQFFIKLIVLYIYIINKHFRSLVFT